MKPRILWVEDSARSELSSLVGPIYFSGKYDFNLAEDVTRAVRFVETKQFEVMVIDLRLPPGSDDYWVNLYKQNGSNRAQAHLGLNFISWLVGIDNKAYGRVAPAWVEPERIGVFTVESWSEVGEQIQNLRVKKYVQKTAGHSDTILLELIEELLNGHNGAGNGT